MSRAVAVVGCLSLAIACNSKGSSPRPETDADAAVDVASGGDGGDGVSGPADSGDATVIDPDAIVVSVLERTRINSHAELANFQRAKGDVDFAGGPFAYAHLVLDLDSSCFPFDRWKDDPPPAGQSWPAQCDAFDRMLEVVLDPAEGATASPDVELVRAITPFGGPLHLEADITDVANGLPGAHKIGAFINTWSDSAGAVSGSSGGWFVSMKVVFKKGPAPRNVLAVTPIFHDFQKTAAAPMTMFETPAGTTRTRIEYRATGHTAEAGTMGPDCIGPAEEFCRRTHTFALDDKPAGALTAWRSSCASLCTLTTAPGPSGRSLTYCKENPCGATASVRAPRANWCPGSVTDPHVIESRDLAAGAHSFSWTLSGLDMGGHWRVSAVMFAYRD
jgi:Peptide-N-glycosidase F, C terminal